MTTEEANDRAATAAAAAFEEEVTTFVERDLLGQTCLLEQQAGISAGNTCRINGGTNKCPAGSSMNYGGQRVTLDADILCPLDSVEQSEWIEASQKGLCGCASQLLDANCEIVEEEMDCECIACPFGMTLGFAYSCTTEIVGPCKSFDCFGKCNSKYDPGNLVGDKETFPPTITDDETDPVAAEGSGGAVVAGIFGGGGPNHHHPVLGTAVLAAALFRMIF
eukprot:CAMPEP_0197175568 /NCGR_PEP_ID=MMETSP1423-20130617/1758_1 /TAXON_ID=476441 /ORGANISM="Pseudo-nitzschia heimii, Strain UNC1101" /LENGTH=220 /DNA_ID=CAMNT_0042624757 /DNA_START=166 /DNA_END=828 /DNA_ORIENTATION=-